MAACTALFFVAGAQAVHDSGAFELDGNATTTTSHDWDQVCFQVTGDSANCGTSTSAGAKAASWTADIHEGGTNPFVNDPNATIFTGGGSKDPQDINQWAWKDGAGGLPDKDNLVHSFAARYSLTGTNNAGTCPNGTEDPTANPPKVFDPTVKCELLFFGSDRFDNSGDAQQGFWFFQNKIGLGTTPLGGGTSFTGLHKDGDLLIISDFSNGGTTSTITIYKWNHLVSGNLELLQTSAAANCTTASHPPTEDAFCGLVNAGTITLPWPFLDKSGTTLNRALNGEFYEGGVNLSKLGLGNECFSSVASETRSSTSTTATLKDFVLGNFGKCDTTVITTPKKGDGTAIPAEGLSIGTGSVSVSDSAQVTVNGTSTFTGTLSFHLCGPFAANSTSNCATGGTAIDAAAGVNPVTANATYSSAAATVTSAGLYCWRADFTSGTTGVPDGHDPAANSTSQSECFLVNPVTPTIPTQASGPVALGSNVSDTATLTGTANKPGTPIINPTTAGGPAGGSITFKLYGPSATAVCDDTPVTGNLVFTSSAIPVSGDGPYSSGNFQPTAVGTYRWVASYTGDTPNTNGVTSACGASNESVLVSNSSLTTTPQNAADPPVNLTDHNSNGLPDISIGTGSVQVTDKAVLSVTGASSFTGTLSFHLCGPIASGTCDGSDVAHTGTAIAAAAGTNPVTANGTYHSAAAEITSAGRYCWRGDFASGTTGVPNASDSSATECFEVLPVTPTLFTTAGPTVVIGTPITDTATLGGTASQPGSPVINPLVAGLPAGGTITFKAYGPNNPTCANPPVFTSDPVAVNGDGTYGPVSFTPVSAGTYRWVASYSGNLPNTLSQSGACNDDNELVVVNPKQPAITTEASSAPPLGSPLGTAISDTAHLTGTAPKPDGTSAGGTITFKLYGPDDATCSNGAIFTSQKDVAGDAFYTSDSFTPSLVGTYRWTASYSGDPPNTLGVDSGCNADNEASLIFSLTPSVSTSQFFYPNDSATITVSNADGALAGTVHLRAWTNATCTDPPLVDQTIDVATGSGTGISRTVETTNTTHRVSGDVSVYWQVDYNSTNPAHNSVPGTCGMEHATIDVTDLP